MGSAQVFAILLLDRILGGSKGITDNLPRHKKRRPAPRERGAGRPYVSLMPSLLDGKRAELGQTQLRATGDDVEDGPLDVDIHANDTG